ncbi:MAG: SRPBCC family protein [Fimbriimonadaceae bacterium]
MDYSDPIVKSVFSRLGAEPSAKNTLALQYSAVTDVPAAKIWEVLENIEQWARWGKPWIERSRWLERRKFEVGARFEQVRRMGFPIGRQVTVETVRELIPGTSVGWWDSEGGIRCCRFWNVETQSDGQTKVTSTEVFVGPLIFLGQLLIRRRWRRLNENLVNGLIELAKRNI